MRSIWKSKRFLIGFIYLFVLLTASFIYSWFFKDSIPEAPLLLYNDNNELLGKAPFSPSLMPPFGSDRFGESIFLQILEGAKFTILFAIAISLLRILFGTCIGILLSLYATKFKRFFQACSEVFYYIPTLFIAFILITPINLVITSNADRLSPNISFALYQAIILIFIALPTISLYISSEVDEFMKKDYISSSQLMGASRFHIIKKHLRVLLLDRVFLLFMEHIVQTLILMIHLALLNIVIGGIQMKEMDEGQFKPVSLSNDWAGLIGLNRNEMNLSLWIIFYTLATFFITILFIKLMTLGIQDALKVRNSQIVAVQSVQDQKTFVKNKDSFSFASLEEKSSSSLHL
ncbi:MULTISPECIES: ABC transporter permease [Bacillus]|uniref:Peptide ABC transporter permease n=1 Tax=Bacillus pseudomycoides TaxID=64104 RepID=A0ABD6TCM1_9BACI|nr:ABC transporter permease subunit [Bacillus pseudomycoides]KFN11708.1 binding--dependent transport system inner membrane component family protein [Bacillus pseudomycoides]MCR8858537.1 ABC transporter permease subunit [Bacillus pseudomycoides]MDR4189431.1 ABC transporter permease subunit [Bacillus pseudomycoides]MED0857457.1 ABC transporter permease subunit [Bacillus pseudomycoides]PEF22023.1 peptide ABC transporter permease [Bacillus pseudomycoides]